MTDLVLGPDPCPLCKREIAGTITEISDHIGACNYSMYVTAAPSNLFIAQINFFERINRWAVIPLGAGLTLYSLISMVIHQTWAWLPVNLFSVTMLGGAIWLNVLSDRRVKAGRQRILDRLTKI